jgi:hypothetical protein
LILNINNAGISLVAKSRCDLGVFKSQNVDMGNYIFSNFGKVRSHF